MAESKLRPPEIAREALRRLAMQRVPPTPDNYRSYYHEIAGTQVEDAFPEKSLKLVAKALPRSTPERLQLALRFEDAIAGGQWPAVIRTLIALCEVPGENSPATTSTARPATTPAHEPALGESESASETLLGTLLAQLLRKGITPLLADHEALAREATELADLVSQPGDTARASEAGVRLNALSGKFEWLAEDQRAIRQSLLDVLRLIVDNIAVLTADDEWLHGQITLLNEMFGKPLDVRVLDEVSRRLRDVIDKQSHLKRQLSDAQARLKSMLAGFIEQLAGFANSTCHYHDTLVRCADEIENANDIDELAGVVEEMLSETRSVQETAKRSSVELCALRHEVEAANSRIEHLQRELDETSELVRHDALTGVLNRKGIDEALARAIALARRRGTPLCLGLVDIDNFKQLNDTFGHKTGDQALRHLTTVMRESLRPQDHLGRYGGEEFLIVLPDTEEDEGASVLTRLQRALTKRFFMADNKRLLITFSAGIARLGPSEEPHAGIDRADRAMYAAKRAGKNRVLVAG